MPESLLSRRLKLGTFAGIPLYVHWSFGLSVLYVALSTYHAGIAGVAFSIAQLFGVFFCVTLHEYGHSLTARRFGIGTADITLLPIGGVARLKEMPRIPWQELVVAVAGPAVNVVIAIGLGAFLLFTMAPAKLDAIRAYFEASFSDGLISDESHIVLTQLFTEPSWLGYGLLMLAVNMMLVLFNMIPAFPMDGGRVFRSILAMFLDYRRATSIAFKVGVGCAMVMAYFALRSDPPSWMPLLIAGFIMYAGLTEYRQVNVTETVRDLRVADVMVPSTRCLSMDLACPEVAQDFQQNAAPAVPVVSITQSVVGVLTIQDVLRELRRDADSIRTAGQMLRHDVPMIAVRSNKLLSDLIRQVDRNQRQVAVVDSKDQLVGMLDLDTMMLRANLFRVAQLKHPGIEEPTGFDAIS